jgi:DNA-binding CsgD family transcriptional regulator
VRQLARHRHPDPDRLYEVTGGNPFFVTEVLRGEAENVPATVRDAVLRRTSGLSTGAVETLRLLAALGARTSEHRAFEQFHVSPHTMEECVEAGLLESPSGEIRFRHELARLAILDSLPGTRRRQIHRRILRTLRAAEYAPKDPGEIAYHADLAGDAKDVLEQGPLAADRARRLGAHREAAAEFARVLRWSGDLPDLDRMELLRSHATEAYLAGAIADAVASTESELEILRRSADRVAIGDATRRLAGLLWNTDRKDRALPLARSAVSVLEAAGAAVQLAFAYATMGDLHAQAAEMLEASRWAERALALARRLGLPEVEIGALRSLGSARLCSPLQDGWPAVYQALEMARRSGRPDQVARSLQQINWFGAMHRQFAHSRRFDEAVRFCESHELYLDRLRLSESHCVELMHRGRWSEATDLAASILAQQGVSAVDRIEPLYVVGRIRARRGDPAVWQPLDDALAVAAPRNELAQVGNVRAARAEAAWLEGEHRQMVREAAAAFDLSLLSNDPWIVGELALWLWRGGSLPHMPQCIESHPYGQQIRGSVRQAAAAWLRLGCPFEAACSLIDSPAERDLRRAYAMFRRLGCVPGEAMAARSLRRMGVRGVRRRPHRSTRANPYLLTPRELEVLDLVALGLTDAEVATKLSLGTRTVNHHVSAALGKMDARSRLEAVQKLHAIH